MKIDYLFPLSFLVDRAPAVMRSQDCDLQRKITDINVKEYEKWMKWSRPARPNR